MNVTSGIVKNRSKQAPWLRESCDYGWKEEWKGNDCYESTVAAVLGWLSGG
jgi:hypothetical protein